MRILRKQNTEDFLFFDIETAPAVPELIKDSPLWDAWEYHCIKNNIEDVADSYLEQSPLHAEFGRIACISIGAVRDGSIILKSFSNENEAELLNEFNESVSKFANNKTYLCGHVITGFDIPFIMKRCMVHRILPHILFDVAHIKPWELSVMDTATLWKGTSFKMSTLISLTAALGLESPKDDISGADVGRLYYEGEIDRIVKYCEKDVVAVINVVQALRAEESLSVAEVVEEKPVGVIEYLWGGGEYTDEIKESLKGIISKMTKIDKSRAMDILNSLPSKAKGKITFITKKDVKELFV